MMQGTILISMMMRIALLMMMMPMMMAQGDEDNPLTQFTDDEYEECFNTIVVTLNKPQEFRRILHKAGPRMIDLAYEWLRERQMPDAADTPEFWNKYPEYKRKQSPEKRKELYNIWWEDSAKYYSVVCRNPVDPECIGMENLGLEMNKVMSGYVASGDCSTQASRAKEEAEKLAEKEKIPKLG